jgi:hypothetical protein
MYFQFILSHIASQCHGNVITWSTDLLTKLERFRLRRFVVLAGISCSSRCFQTRAGTAILEILTVVLLNVQVFWNITFFILSPPDLPYLYYVGLMYSYLHAQLLWLDCLAPQIGTLRLFWRSVTLFRSSRRNNLGYLLFKYWDLPEPLPRAFIPLHYSSLWDIKNVNKLCTKREGGFYGHST